jgi:glycosyltransferase involved in cell wall biosynthesis
MSRLLPPPHEAFRTTPELRRKRIAFACRILRQNGPSYLARILLSRFVMPALSRQLRHFRMRRIREILRAADPARPPIVILATVDYAFPYRQRPQHLALAFARLGHPVFYVSPRSGHDQFLLLGHPAPHLCITDTDEFLPELLGPSAVLFLMSTDNRVDPPFLEKARSWGARIVYDYIDHIDAAISLTQIPEGHRQAHGVLLRDPAVLVVASARLLHDEVAALRSTHLVLAENAVDGAHYGVTRRTANLAPEMAAAVRRGRPILGYFGALASWFDYDLVLELARFRPEVSIVLIGPDYDGSCRIWRQKVGPMPENLILVPPIPYDRLPQQAAWFDVAMVPFVINEITNATSPLKLYEYFALGTPVIATSMPECVKHQPAVAIADDATGFAVALDKALLLRDDPEHRALLAREAGANDWRARAEAIIAALPFSPHERGRIIASLHSDTRPG